MSRTTTRRERTYSTAEVCALVGISYRKADYWIRTGKIRLEHNPLPGSGNPRRWTADEVRRLKQLVARLAEAHEVIEAWSSGTLWDSSELDLPTHLSHRNTKEGGDDDAVQGVPNVRQERLG